MKNGILMTMMLVIFIIPVNMSAKSTIDEVKLSKCVDGDTARFIKNDIEIKVRFLAIDTPETVYPGKDVELYGKDASEYTCKRLTDAKKIKLEYDENSGLQDKYDRYLAWVFVDGILLQEKLVEIGYAKVAYLYGDYKYTDTLKEAENKARTNSIGMWSEKKNEEGNLDTSMSKKETKEEPNNDNNNIFSILLNFLGEIFEKILLFIDDFINDML